MIWSSSTPPATQRAVAAVEEVHAHRAQRVGRRPRLVLPLLGRAAGARLAPRQVEDAHLASLLRQQRDGAAAAQLHVVGVGADGQNVELASSWFS